MVIDGFLIESLVLATLRSETPDGRRPSIQGVRGGFSQSWIIQNYSHGAECIVCGGEYLGCIIGATANRLVAIGSADYVGRKNTSLRDFREVAATDCEEIKIASTVTAC